MLAIFAGASLAAASLAATPPAAPPRAASAEAQTVCKPHGVIQASDPAPALLYRQQDRVVATPLAKLPKANHEKAVARTVGPCAVPVVVGYGVGG